MRRRYRKPLALHHPCSSGCCHATEHHGPAQQCSHAPLAAWLLGDRYRSFVQQGLRTGVPVRDFPALLLHALQQFHRCRLRLGACAFELIAQGLRRAASPRLFSCLPARSRQCPALRRKARLCRFFRFLFHLRAPCGKFRCFTLGRGTRFGIDTCLFFLAYFLPNRFQRILFRLRALAFHACQFNRFPGPRFGGIGSPLLRARLFPRLFEQVPLGCQPGVIGFARLALELLACLPQACLPCLDAFAFFRLGAGSLFCRQLLLDRIQRRLLRGLAFLFDFHLLLQGFESPLLERRTLALFLCKTNGFMRTGFRQFGRLRLQFKLLGCLLQLLLLGERSRLARLTRGALCHFALLQAARFFLFGARTSFAGVLRSTLRPQFFLDCVQFALLGLYALMLCARQLGDIMGLGCRGFCQLALQLGNARELLQAVLFCRGPGFGRFARSTFFLLASLGQPCMLLFSMGTGLRIVAGGELRSLFLLNRFQCALFFRRALLLQPCQFSGFACPGLGHRCGLTLLFSVLPGLFQCLFLGSAFPFAGIARLLLGLPARLHRRSMFFLGTCTGFSICAGGLFCRQFFLGRLQRSLCGRSALPLGFRLLLQHGERLLFSLRPLAFQPCQLDGFRGFQRRRLGSTPLRFSLLQRLLDCQLRGCAFLFLRHACGLLRLLLHPQQIRLLLFGCCSCLEFGTGRLLCGQFFLHGCKCLLFGCGAFAFGAGQLDCFARLALRQFRIPALPFGLFRSLFIGLPFRLGLRCGALGGSLFGNQPLFCQHPCALLFLTARLHDLRRLLLGFGTGSGLFHRTRFLRCACARLGLGAPLGFGPGQRQLMQFAFRPDPRFRSGANLFLRLTSCLRGLGRDRFDVSALGRRFLQFEFRLQAQLQGFCRLAFGVGPGTCRRLLLLLGQCEGARLFPRAHFRRNAAEQGLQCKGFGYFALAGELQFLIARLGKHLRLQACFPFEFFPLARQFRHASVRTGTRLGFFDCSAGCRDPFRAKQARLFIFLSKGFGSGERTRRQFLFACDLFRSPLAGLLFGLDPLLRKLSGLLFRLGTRTKFGSFLPCRFNPRFGGCAGFTFRVQSSPACLDLFLDRFRIAVSLGRGGRVDAGPVFRQRPGAGFGIGAVFSGNGGLRFGFDARDRLAYRLQFNTGMRGLCLPGFRAGLGHGVCCGQAFQDRVVAHRML